MAKVAKRMIAILMTVVLTFGVFQVSGETFFPIANARDATDVDDFVFEINESHTGYILEEFDHSSSMDFDYVEIPSTYRGLPVEEIGRRAFRRCDIRSIFIPEGVKKIGDQAFERMDDLRDLILPSTIEYVGEDAFGDDPRIRRVAINGTMADWCKIDFYNIKSNPLFSNTEFYLSSDPSSGETSDWWYYLHNSSQPPFHFKRIVDTITLPENLEVLKPYVFYGINSISNYVLNAQLKRISSKAFYSCKMRSVEIPASVISIAPDSFYNCSYLSQYSVDIRNPQFKAIDGLLYDRSGNNLISFPCGRSVTTYEIPDQTTGICSLSFYNCKMQSIEIPASVSSIASDSFYSCKYLSQYTVDTHNTRFKSVDGVLFDYSGNNLLLFPCGRAVTTYEIPDQTSEINRYAFYYNSTVKKVIVPQSVTAIDSTSFKSSVKVYCKEDSYAKHFCEENNRAYGLYVDMVYNANGGVSNERKKALYVDSAIGTLSVPQREGYTFLGWYTEQNGGVKINPFDVITSTEDFTAYACWGPVSSLQCGEDMTWSLEGNRLVIDGTGDMYDYPKGGAPWAGLSGYITELVIREQVLSISDYAFDLLSNVQSIRVDSPLCRLPVHYDQSSVPQIVGYSGEGDIDDFAMRNNLPFESLGESGSCGEGLAWTYQSDTKTLSVLYYYGEGVMEDYNNTGSNNNYSEVRVSSGTIDYVASWPFGFNNNNYYFGLYNKTPKSNSESSTQVTRVSTSIVGYLYWHWCRGTNLGPEAWYNGINWNRTIETYQTSTYSTFHAFFSDSPIGVSGIGHCFDHIDGNQCGDTRWWFGRSETENLPVYRCSWTTYNKVYNNSTTAAPWNVYRSEITNVRFDDRVTYIGDNALYNCTKVETIQFPKALTGMGSNVVEGTQWYSDRNGSMVSVANFLYAYKIKNDDVVVIGNGLTGVARNFGKSIQSSGAGPESIQISRSVSTIQDGALSFNPDLTQIYVDKGNPYYKAINSVLYTKNSRELVCYPAGLHTTAVTIPDTVTTIRPYAFAGNTFLSEITINKNVTCISPTSFENTSLRTIIGYIGSYAQIFAGENGYSFVPISSTVQFDCSGGTIEDKENKTVFIHTGSMIGELPIPEREGYVFLGWFYESDEDEFLVTESFVVNEDITIYAYWEKIRESEPHITDILIKNTPSKTTYYVGDTLNTDGLVICAVYSDGKMQEVCTGFYCTPYTLTTSGVQDITVTFAGKTTRFEVGVTNVVPVSISIAEPPSVISYHTRDRVNTKGLAVSVEMNNGETKVIRDMSLLTLEYDFESSTGVVPVYVSFSSGGRTVRTFFEVEVSDNPLIYSHTVAIDSGDSFGVPVYIQGNDGLMGYVIELYYDADAFEPVTVEGGYSAGSWNTDIGYGQDGCLRVIWNDSSEYKSDGLLFTAFFDTKNDVGEGDYPFDISYSKSDTFNENYTDVSLECVGTVVSVLHANPVPVIYATDRNIQGGDNFDLSVCIRNNIGFEDLTTISIRYDNSAYEYAGVTPVDEAYLLRATDNGSGTIKIVLNEVDSSADDGILVTLHFKASTKASGEYKFRLTVNDSKWKCSDCTVWVARTIETPVIYSQDISGLSYSQVEVPIYISDNPGLMGFSLRFEYPDEEMGLSEVCLSDAWNGNLEYNCRNGILQVVWTGSENVNADGEIFTLVFDTFSVEQNANSSFMITYDSQDTFDEDWNEVQLDCRGFSVSIVEPEVLPGDANGDRTIDLKDVTVITRWLAGGWNVTINEEQSDVNKDGEVNLKDAVLIRRFLAGGWNVVLK